MYYTNNKMVKPESLDFYGCFGVFQAFMPGKSRHGF
jgi:hypothetical protein